MADVVQSFRGTAIKQGPVRLCRQSKGTAELKPYLAALLINVQGHKHLLIIQLLSYAFHVVLWCSVGSTHDRITWTRHSSMPAVLVQLREDNTFAQAWLSSSTASSLL